MHFIKKYFLPHTHPGVTMITVATAVRWVGWGFVENALPVFIFSLSNGSFAESGIVRSVYSIVFLVVSPWIARLAQRWPAVRLITLGLLVYPLIGLSYFLAGALGTVIFVVIARALNGFTFACDSIGRSVYFRRHVSVDRIGSAFGYFETVANFWWIIAALIGIVLVEFFDIHYLFLCIIPTSFIALYMIRSVPQESITTSLIPSSESLPVLPHTWFRQAYNFFASSAYVVLLRDMWHWRGGLKRLAAFKFCTRIVSNAVDFFVPIHLFTQGNDLPHILLFVLIYNLPAVFGAPMGQMIDALGRRIIPWCFAGMGTMLAALILVHDFWLQLVCMFIFSCLSMFLSLSMSTEATKYTVGDDEHLGSFSGGWIDVSEVAALIGPVAIGILIDMTGFFPTFIGLAFGALLIAGILAWRWRV